MISLNSLRWLVMVAALTLLAGIFVQEGKLRWDSALGKIFPELKDQMNAEFAKITLEELLSLAVTLYKEFSGEPAPSGASVWPLNQGRKNTALSKG
jgi:CubicO group peptidase (beta-lactamase class C family)